MINYTYDEAIRHPSHLHTIDRPTQKKTMSAHTNLWYGEVKRGSKTMCAQYSHYHRIFIRK